MRRDTAELLAAYVDGVTELSAEERRRVEARLADDPALREDEAATRELLSQLRTIELAPPSAEPDWSGLERSIHDAVGPDVPRPWWRRWRWALPSAALAMAAALVLLVVTRPADDTPSVALPVAPVVDRPVPVQQDVEPTTVALYLDGVDLEVEIGVGLEEALDDPMDGLDDTEIVDGFMTPSDFTIGAVDDLDDDALEHLEGWLAKEQRGSG